MRSIISLKRTSREIPVLSIEGEREFFKSEKKF